MGISAAAANVASTTSSIGRFAARHPGWTTFGVATPTLLAVGAVAGDDGKLGGLKASEIRTVVGAAGLIAGILGPRPVSSIGWGLFGASWATQGVDALTRGR